MLTFYYAQELDRHELDRVPTPKCFHTTLYICSTLAQARLRSVEVEHCKLGQMRGMGIGEAEHCKPAVYSCTERAATSLTHKYNFNGVKQQTAGDAIQWTPAGF
jgi:hypothetical protein